MWAESRVEYLKFEGVPINFEAKLNSTREDDLIPRIHGVNPNIILAKIQQLSWWAN